MLPTYLRLGRVAALATLLLLMCCETDSFFHSPPLWRPMRSLATRASTQSFVQDVLKPYTMRLHTRDQARSGQQPAQRPFTTWTPTLQNLLQFLVDSREVYRTFEDIIQSQDNLQPFRNSGLERSAALRADIDWLLSRNASLLPTPQPADYALAYSAYLQGLASSSLPKFICHYYNFYFAHTAGGRMIGKRLMGLLTPDRLLQFYKWDGDVERLVEDTKAKVDAVAAQWSETQRSECLEETREAFRFGSAMLRAITPPDVHYKY